ncbi:four helix bundle protein [soil metagenome]
MGTFRKFEDIESWQLARELCKLIKLFTEKGKLIRDFGMRAQIRNSSGSAMDNIAEGFGRGNRKEFITFLGYSTGSVNETQSQLYRCLDYEYISEEEFKYAFELAAKVCNKNGKLIGYLNNAEIRGIRFLKNENKAEITNNKRQTTNLN